ncbi:Uncharacterized protein APZ42_021022 [Daphnia magna]|uniref:Uncharacterized protein n=1 Tax=Daphnia magna TaxID=35525 RepID=A0A164WWX9_9CRUS|nr:Uncharacterized protein APZ42_021022 [Daphnia magna]
MFQNVGSETKLCCGFMRNQDPFLKWKETLLDRYMSTKHMKFSYVICIKEIALVKFSEPFPCKNSSLGSCSYIIVVLWLPMAAMPCLTASSCICSL